MGIVTDKFKPDAINIGEQTRVNLHILRDIPPGIFPGNSYNANRLVVENYFQVGFTRNERGRESVLQVENGASDDSIRIAAKSDSGATRRGSQVQNVLIADLLE